jgi:hypothetical protein
MLHIVLSQVLEVVCLFSRNVEKSPMDATNLHRKRLSTRGTAILQCLAAPCAREKRPVASSRFDQSNFKRSPKNRMITLPYPCHSSSQISKERISFPVNIDPKLFPPQQEQFQIVSKCMVWEMFAHVYT